jgi:DNA-binding SARP family transcriptional activator
VSEGAVTLSQEGLRVSAPLPNAVGRSRVQLLGQFQLQVDQQPVVLSANRQRLIALLALWDEPMSRAQVTSLLWPHLGQSRAGANLRSTLWRLQRSYGAAALEILADELRLADGLSTDLREVTTMARRLLDRSAPMSRTQLEQALACNFWDDLLPDWRAETWLHAERERFRQLRLHALEALCERLAGVGCFGAAVDAGLAALNADPWRASAHDVLTSACLAGDNAEAAPDQRWLVEPAAPGRLEHTVPIAIAVPDQSVQEWAPPERQPEHQLVLLGRFQLCRDGRPLMIGASAQRLLVLLALQPGPVTRVSAASMLWPDTPTRRASATLRSVLWRLQRLCPQVIDATARDLSLARCVSVDMHSAKEMAQRLLDPATMVTDHDLSQALRSHLHDDLLPDWHEEEWLQVERERFRQLRLHALEALCERLTAAGWYGAAVDTGLEALRTDPFREPACQVLIKAYLAEGNQREALRQYRALQYLMREELGLEPSGQLQQLVRTLLTGLDDDDQAPAERTRRLCRVQ